MLIHSVLPPQFTIAGLEAIALSQENTIGGVKVMVEPMGDATARITRIISTNPEDYLNPNLQPGNILTYGLK